MKTQISNSKDLGQMFRDARIIKGMTIEETAKQAGVSPTTLRNMEKSRGCVRTDVAFALFSVVGIKFEASHTIVA